MIMEGRPWHKVAIEHGATLRPNMQKGKIYLYQIFTTCFAEFDTLEQANEFKAYADKNIPYWDYDPVAVVDTNDNETVEKWKPHMEQEGYGWRT